MFKRRFPNRRRTYPEPEPLPRMRWY
jgi:hypothetical protein